MQADPLSGADPGPGPDWIATPATATSLACHRAGPADASGRARISLLHGFAQTGRCLGPLADALAEQHAVRALDAPGHGGSLRHRGADLWAAAQLLVDDAGPQVLVGYSMGGRLALHAPLLAPSLVSGLVLIGATAGIDDPERRRQRRETDEARAQHLETVGVNRFVREWLGLPMFAGLPDWARFEHHRRTNTVEGLAASLRRAGTGSMEPLWDRLAEITCPVLLVTGGLDADYTAVAERLAAGLGGPSDHLVVPGAGHAAHLEQPGIVTREVRSALSDWI